MNRMIWPSCFARSLSTAFSRSSNSPRNLAPAISAPRSRLSMRFIANAFRHLAVDDALREAFDDRRLADAGFADQHRIVLRASLQGSGSCGGFRRRDRRSGRACPARLARSGRIVYFSSACRVSSAFSSSTVWPPRRFVDRRLDGAAHDAPPHREFFSGCPCPRSAASTNSSLETYWSPRSCDSLSQNVQQPAEIVREMDLAGRALDLRQLVQRLAESRTQQVQIGTPALVSSGRTEPPC